MIDIASKSNNYHYNKRLKKYADENRKTMTKSAACMWKYVLSGRKMLGYQFRRERPILDYIVDFVCLELLLIIEVDGITHECEDQQRLDRIRDERLGEIGMTVLRFSSLLVLKDSAAVAEIIADWIMENAIQPPSPKRLSTKKRERFDGDKWG